MLLFDIPVPTWRDILDILFLTIVVYQLYNWFRETRALGVLIGLAVMAISPCGRNQSSWRPS